MQSVHYFVIEDPIGVFHVERHAKHGHVCGRFANGEDAHAHAVQLKRDFLSPLNWSDGTALTIKERVIIGLWGWDPSQWPFPVADNLRIHPKDTDAATAPQTTAEVQV